MFAEELPVSQAKTKMLLEAVDQRDQRGPPSEVEMHGSSRCCFLWASECSLLPFMAPPRLLLHSSVERWLSLANNSSVTLLIPFPIWRWKSKSLSCHRKRLVPQVTVTGDLPASDLHCPQQINQALKDCS